MQMMDKYQHNAIRPIVDRRSDPNSVGCNKFRVAVVLFPYGAQSERRAR